MITITIDQTKDETKIVADGHAGYNPGNDIVCSAVSALFYAFGAYVTSTSGIETKCKFGDGHSEIWLNKGAGEAFKMFKLGLQLIEAEFPQCVSLKN